MERLIVTSGREFIPRRVIETLLCSEFEVIFFKNGIKFVFLFQFIGNESVVKLNKRKYRSFEQRIFATNK
jgi:hypothetical protein